MSLSFERRRRERINYLNLKKEILFFGGKSFFAQGGFFG